MVPPLIALEEHFLSSAMLETAKDAWQEQFKNIPGLEDKLCDINELRLHDMNQNMISMQVISHGCIRGGPSLQACRQGNDQLATAVQAHRQRFAGFAMLPVADPEASAEELERCVRQLGFVGALIDNHAGGKYYDGPEYDVMWQKAQALDVPIYLHPTWPAEHMMSPYTGNFTAGASRALSSSSWGWHEQTGLHILRLFAAGVFDRFPRLKIVIGHFGEMLPFQLSRIYRLSVRWGDRQRSMKQVWDENIWITTSGVWSIDPMRCILGNTRVDHILFGVDYPLETNEDGLRWVQELEQSGLVTQVELEMICHKNAEKLLNIVAPHRSS